MKNTSKEVRVFYFSNKTFPKFLFLSKALQQRLTVEIVSCFILRAALFDGAEDALAALFRHLKPLTASRDEVLETAFWDFCWSLEPGVNIINIST